MDFRFNSRLPCGSRPRHYNTSGPNMTVSTHGSLAGADINTPTLATLQKVSTHGSLAGADINQPASVYSRSCFNSRLPCGSRRLREIQRGLDLAFKLTAPLREPTPAAFVGKSHLDSFNSRLPCGSRLTSSLFTPSGTTFQLTAPLREPTAKIRIFKKHFIKRRMRFLAFQISLLLFSTISDLT